MSENIPLSIQTLYDIMDAASVSGALSSQSVYGYKQRLKQLVRDWGNNDVEWTIANPLKALKHISAPESRKAYIVAVMSCMSHDAKGVLAHLKDKYRKKWLEEFVRVKELCKEKLYSQKPSDAQKRAMITWDDMLQARDKLTPGTIEHIIVGLYCEVPARNDWCHVFVSTTPRVDTKQYPNYVVLTPNKNATLCLNSFKTNNTKRRRTTKVDVSGDAPILDLAPPPPAFSATLSKELSNSIRRSLVSQPREYLLTQENDVKQPYKNKNGCEGRVLKILRAALDNPHVTVNSVRHAYACHIQRNPKLSERDKRQLAAKSMHSGNMSKLYCFVQED